MEQKGNPESDNYLITWGKAYLYAFGWLIGWGVISIPIVGMSGDYLTTAYFTTSPSALFPLPPPSSLQLSP